MIGDGVVAVEVAPQRQHLRRRVGAHLPIEDLEAQGLRGLKLGPRADEAEIELIGAGAVDHRGSKLRPASAVSTLRPGFLRRPEPMNARR